MSGARNEFPNVTSLRSEAQGEPGKRTFRLLMESGSSSAAIWLEKEQLFQLALGIQQLLTAIPREQVAPSSPPTDTEPPALTHLDFKADKLVLGYDTDRRLFVLDAHAVEDEGEESATVRLWANEEQAKGFSEEAFRVCAAGRPICRLCNGPIDPTGHRCPRDNGHITGAGL